MAVEVSIVRKRLLTAISAARGRATERREQTAQAGQAYDTFLQRVATPVTKLVANALKSENYAFTVFTPRGGLRLASDRGRDDYVEFVLDTAGERPQVCGRISLTRGSRTLTNERPIKPDASPDALSEDDVLEFLLEALEPWLER